MALHEALLALQTGSSGLLTLKEDDPHFKKRSPLSPFVHPGELEILDRLTQLGRHYRTLNEFSEKTLESQTSGLYILSFAVELRSILHAYLQTLSELESQCLVDQSLSLSHLLISLSDYALIFPQLVHLLSTLESNGFRGCQLLDVIRRATLDGNTNLSSTMKRLLAATHRILLKQITSLLTRGELYDDFREFFIGLNKNVNVEALGATTNSSSYSQYELLGELLPSYISLPLAEKILFVGESWLLLKNNDEEVLSLDDEEKTQQIRHELNRLTSADELNLFELERIVERTRIELSLTLRNLFVERFQLCDELEQIRALFLLERGELFNLFVQRMGPLLLQTKKPSPALENDLNEIFKQCLNDLQLDSVLTKAEKFKFKLQFPVGDASAQETSGARRLLSRLQNGGETNSFEFWSCAWAHLSLHYKVKYPLKAFFTDHCQQRYNEIFQLLIVLRYVQAELNRLWLTLKSRRENSFVWHLRNAMSFFIDHFQYYIQIDVLEYKYQQLIRAIETSRDFQQIKHLHELFLAEIQTNSFMLLTSAFQSLRNIISTCVSFCIAVKERGRDVPVATLKQLAKDFNEEIRHLFGVLGMVQKHNALPHLGIFLTRLDFNRFLTNNNGSFGEF